MRSHLLREDRRVSWSLKHLDASPDIPEAASHVPDHEEFGWLLGDDEPASPSAKASLVWGDAFDSPRFGQVSSERQTRVPALLATPDGRSNATPELQEDAKLANFRAGTSSAVLNGAGGIPPRTTTPPRPAPPAQPLLREFGLSRTPEQQAPRTQGQQQPQREAQREEDGRGQADQHW
eukprot:CAMPEP_0180153028 /NCGR_PEP_ID=MMETSP0986-20121125/23212_1 /TAXON_ID=697907 /ORGANISM="non described non described, Strain CCMP2293" /LENGTH=177 /DNA_ID=CAMNT_0022100899 /DNA_START=79 /DNA_END=609 /DNA_ORIENTATION=+